MATENISDDRLLKGVTVSRLMSPGDANIYGNVHGGIILNMMEEAGAILGTRYCNVKNKADNADHPGCAVSIARIEHMDFLQPMHIGEVAELAGEIVYTSSHSMQIVVSVWAEDCIKGIRRLTNRARMWYVPLFIDNPNEVGKVPQMKYATAEAEENGKAEYDKQKEDRQLNQLNMSPIPSVLAPFTPVEQYTAAYSQTALTLVVGVNEVTLSGHCRGGVILKIMDECAGIVSVKHCQNPAVTACMTATNFHQKIPRGSVVTIFGQATFTSARSIEVEVIVEMEMVNHKHDGSGRVRALDSLFTYVCLGQDGKPLPVPALQLKGSEDQAKFALGKQRYERRKARRARKPSTSAHTIYTRQFTADTPL